MRNKWTVVAIAATSSLALAQPDMPIVFVANNGNLEGSVSSFSVAPDGTPVFIDKRVTGARASTSEDQPGANAISLSISPNGQYLATGHATGSISGDYVSVLSVSADATMAIEVQHLMPETTFAVTWVDDTLLAVLQTEVFGTNELVVFSFDPGGPTLTEIDRIYCGTFATSVVKHPKSRVLYVNDSGSVDEVYAFTVDLNGHLSQLQNIALGQFPLGLAIEPNGKALYAAGGISSGGHAFNVLDLDTDGVMTPNAGNPFTSPGQSPKGFSVDPTGAMLFVEHGTDATIRSFSIDQNTGAPTSTGHSFDVGLQGTLGGSAAWGSFLFVTDESTAIDGVRGLYSLAVNFATGAMTPVTATPVDTTGITPESVRVWDPGAQPCLPDLVVDGVLNFFDVQLFLQLFAEGDLMADFTGDGVLNFFDVQRFLGEFAAGCP